MSDYGDMKSLPKQGLENTDQKSTQPTSDKENLFSTVVNEGFNQVKSPATQTPSMSNHKATAGFEGRTKEATDALFLECFEPKSKDLSGDWMPHFEAGYSPASYGEYGQTLLLNGDAKGLEELFATMSPEEQTLFANRPTNGMPPLHFSETMEYMRPSEGNQNLDCMRVLLNNHADPNLQAANGLTPMQIAKQGKNEKAAALLEAHGAKKAEAKHNALMALNAFCFVAACTSMMLSSNPEQRMEMETLASQALDRIAALQAKEVVNGKSRGKKVTPSALEVLAKNPDMGKSPLTKRVLKAGADITEPLGKSGENIMQRALREAKKEPPDISLLETILETGTLETLTDADFTALYSFANGPSELHSVHIRAILEEFDRRHT